jgi:hypothetical protein
MGPGTLMRRARTNRILPANPAEMMVFRHKCHEKCLDDQPSKTRFQLSIGIESERAVPGALLLYSYAKDLIIIVRFHSQNHFFVDVHFLTSVEAKTERIIRFLDDQSTERN